MPVKRRKCKLVPCPRCQGKGYRYLVVGPHVIDGQGVPGGRAKYDCRRCAGTGKVKINNG